MPNYEKLNAGEILATVLADGVVDAEEVQALQRKLDQDWVVDRTEIELLFRVNQSLGTRDERCYEWTLFFAENVSRLLIMDMDTPGEIDQDEGDWLANLFDQYGVGNATELSLLTSLKKEAAQISGRIVERCSSL